MYPENSSQQILDYLEHQLPDYPFDPQLDPEFVQELAADFQDVDILEEIKGFRWYYDNQPLARVKSIRLALRRWIAKAHPCSPP
ncbi:hypothetical protein MYX84_13250 [Acidobacteria bacterium AH-259-O06]|nr:hypothetical protein [Acidobacteria bacterium AH-259-O06]